MSKQKTQQPDAINVEEVLGKSEAFILKYKIYLINAPNPPPTKTAIKFILIPLVYL